MSGSDELPTFAELALAKLEASGRRDKVIEVKVSIPTARMMVEAETAERASAATLSARVDELEEALRPFALDVPEAIAKAAPRFPLWTGFRGTSSGYVEVADLQRAREVMCRAAAPKD